MLMTGGEEVALQSFRLVVTDRVGRVLGVPVVPSSGVHGAVGPDRTVLVVGMAIWGSLTIEWHELQQAVDILEVRGELLRY